MIQVGLHGRLRRWFGRRCEGAAGRGFVQD